MTRDRKIHILILASLVFGILFLLIDIKPISITGQQNKEVSLGEKFRLKQGQKAKVKGQNILLSITELENRPVGDFGGGPSVTLLLSVNGKDFSFDGLSWDKKSKLPYEVKIVKSDYKSYADLIIDKPEIICFDGSYYKENAEKECLQSLANSLSFEHREFEKYGIVIDYAAICNRLTDGKEKGRCFGGLGSTLLDPDKCEEYGEGRDICLEEVARNLYKPEICEKVKNPSEYCLYTTIQKGNDIKACNIFPIDAPVFGNLYWSKKCYKDFAQKENQGLTICNQVAVKDKSVCLEALTGAF